VSERRCDKSMKEATVLWRGQVGVTEVSSLHRLVSLTPEDV
jgi:hypothetical protein